LERTLGGESGAESRAGSEQGTHKRQVDRHRTR
jgi:hypothetical protein